MNTTPVKWFCALLAVVIMWKLAYRDGVRDGELGLNYWQGWQDAMTATQYGTRPYNSEDSLLK